MAYAFERVNNALDKANIFAAQPEEGEENKPDSEVESRNISQPLTAGSAGPQLSNNLSRSTVSTRDTGSGLGAQNVAVKAARERGVSIPGVFGRLGESLGEQKTKLKTASDAYVENQRRAAEAATSTTDQQIGDIERGVEGAGSRAREILTRPTSAPVGEFRLPEFEDFEKRNADIKAATGSTVGLNRLLQRSKGADYTPEMAAYDRSLIESAPGFKNLISKLGEDYGALQQQYGSYKTDKKTEAQDAANKALKENQSSLENRIKALMGLRDYQNETEAKQLQDQEIARLNEYRRNLEERRDPGLHDRLRQLREDAVNRLRSDYAGSEEELRDIAESDFLQYLSPDLYSVDKSKGPAYSYNKDNVYSPEEAENFRRLATALGDPATRRGNLYRPPTDYAGNRDYYNLNENKLRANMLLLAKDRNSGAKARDFWETAKTGRGDKGRVVNTVTDGLRAYASDAPEYDGRRGSYEVKRAMSRLGLDSSKTFSELLPELIKKFDPDFTYLRNFVPDDSTFNNGDIYDSDANMAAANRLKRELGYEQRAGTMTSENLFRSWNNTPDQAVDRIRKYSKLIKDIFLENLRSQ